jgi:hypothetical protein
MIICKVVFLGAFSSSSLKLLNNLKGILAGIFFVYKKSKIPVGNSITSLFTEF